MSNSAVVAAAVLVCIGLLALMRRRFVRGRGPRGIDVGEISQEWRSEQVKEHRD